MTAVTARRLLYAAALAAALCAQIMSDNYWAHFFLAALLALPVLSLALSLPGILRCRVSLAAAPAAAVRGAEGAWLVRCRTGFFPVARLSMRCVETNLLTGRRRCERVRLAGVCDGTVFTLCADTAHCGVLELRIRRLGAADALGLFYVPLRAPAPAALVCRPVSAPVPAPVWEEPPRPAAVRTARGGDAEDHELRPYRPGDAMRAVHWKLSAKWDDLIVREPLAGQLRPPVLTLDRFGTPEALDALLDRFLSLSRALVAAQRPHTVLWLDRSGTPVSCAVADERQLDACLRSLLGTAAPAAGPALTDAQLPAGHGGRIHIPAGGGGSDE